MAPRADEFELGVRRIGDGPGDRGASPSPDKSGDGDGDSGASPICQSPILANRGRGRPGGSAAPGPRAVTADCQWSGTLAGKSDGDHRDGDGGGPGQPGIPGRALSGSDSCALDGQVTPQIMMESPPGCFKFRFKFRATGSAHCDFANYS